MKAEAERQAAAKAEAERQAAAKAEAERQAAAKAEAERQAAAKAEAERQAAAKAEAERQAAAKAEAARQAAAKAEAERARIASEEARKAQELQLQRYNERMRQEEQSRRERDERQRQWNLQQQREAEQRRQQAAADQARRDAERERLNREAEQRVFENLRRQQTFSNLPSSPTIFRPPSNNLIYVTGGGGRAYNSSGGRIWPVALDLNDDGRLEILSLSDGVDIDTYTVEGVTYGSTAHFDSDGNGILDNTAWIGPHDGILAIDLGNSEVAGPDGKISRPEEIAFSLWKSEEERVAELKAQGIDDTGQPVTDLEGLRFAFDSNQDNRLDSRDSRWGEFRIWQDFNQNGSSDEGELSTLEAEGIVFIDLMPRGEGVKLFPDGSMITGTSSAKRIDGTSILVGDVALAYRPQP